MTSQTTSEPYVESEIQEDELSVPDDLDSQDAPVGQQPEENSFGEETTDAVKENGDDAKKPSRSQVRIKQLVTTKKKLEQQLEQERKLRESYEAKLASGEQKALGLEKKYIQESFEAKKKEIDSLRQSLKRVKEEGDADAEIDVMLKINSALVDQRILEAKVKNLEKHPDPASARVEAQPVRQPAQQTNRSPESAPLPDTLVKWVEKNQWFTAPESEEEYFRKNKAIRLARQLEQEGYTYEDTDFYSELDRRLAQGGRTMVHSKGNDEGVDTGASENTATPQQNIGNPRQPSAAQQTRAGDPSQQQKRSIVSGGARAAASPKAGQSPRLTKEQEQVARKLNLTNEQYAQALLDYEMNSKS